MAVEAEMLVKRRPDGSGWFVEPELIVFSFSAIGLASAFWTVSGTTLVGSGGFAPTRVWLAVACLFGLPLGAALAAATKKYEIAWPATLLNLTVTMICTYVHLLAGGIGR